MRPRESIAPARSRKRVSKSSSSLPNFAKCVQPFENASAGDREIISGVFPAAGETRRFFQAVHGRPALKSIKNYCFAPWELKKATTHDHIALLQCPPSFSRRLGAHFARLLGWSALGSAATRKR